MRNNEDFMLQTSGSISGRRTTQQLNYSHSTKKSESYWNDWFGRPGF